MRLARAVTVVLLAVLAAACDRVRTGETVTQDATVSCTRCHGYPPPANGPFLMPTTTAHPANSDCHLCHPGTVEADNVTIIPPTAGGLHMDGVVEATGGHAAGYANPAQHGPDALAFLGGSGTLHCTDCHGTDYAGGSSQKSCNQCHADTSFADWQTNCTFCHGTRTASWTSAQPALAAPPVAVDRTSAPAKVGAHQAHLTQGTYAAALPCASCHVVPDAPATPLVAGAQHFQGNGAAATITFGDLARQGGAPGTYAGSGGSCAVYCHGSGSGVSGGQNTTPAWTSTGLACDACHGQPPQTGPTAGGVLAPNAHAYHVAAGATCADCHLGYTGSTVNLSTHVNGARDVVVVRASDATQVTVTGWDCATCHDAKGVPAATHAVPYPASAHGPDALAGIGACTGCHGADYGGDLTIGAPSCNDCHAQQVTASGPEWKTNCTFCHGTRTAGVTSATALAAPPVAVDRTTTPRKVGAHQAHLTDGTIRNALPCSTCHAVPTDALGHFAGYAATGQAPVAFDALASNLVTAPAYAGNGNGCTVYCHGSGTVGVDGDLNKTVKNPAAKYAWPLGSVAQSANASWTATGLTCTSCHGDPPDTGFISTTSTSNRHAQHLGFTYNGQPVTCATCHVGFTAFTVDKALHANGARDVIVVPLAGGTQRILPGANGNGWNCTDCHNALGI